MLVKSHNSSEVRQESVQWCPFSAFFWMSLRFWVSVAKHINEIDKVPRCLFKRKRAIFSLSSIRKSLTLCTCVRAHLRVLMTGKSCEVKMRNAIRRNKLSVLLYLSTKMWENLPKMYCLTTADKTNLPRFQGARLDHVRVKLLAKLCVVWEKRATTANFPI